MKKVLLASVAALFLATGTAHTYPPRYFNCGKAFVKIQTFHGSAAHGRVFPTVWTISENWEKEDRENLRPITSLNFRCTKEEKCWLNGKFCAGGIADKILRGAKPSDIPVEQATKFDLIINLTTAKALGLTIPESFLLRADEVIE